MYSHLKPRRGSCDLQTIFFPQISFCDQFLVLYLGSSQKSHFLGTLAFTTEMEKGSVSSICREKSDNGRILKIFPNVFISAEETAPLGAGIRQH